jgi:hypothetical protein
MGPIPDEKAFLLLEKMAGRLQATVNGHTLMNEPDEYVRERCANAFELAASSGKNISKYLPLLEWSRYNDPHPWVREMAIYALKYVSEMRNSAPLPRSFTTRRPLKPISPSSVREILRKQPLG